jgi:hypothetical protein
MGETERQQAGKCQQEGAAPHDTTTVRNMPISM